MGDFIVSVYHSLSKKIRKSDHKLSVKLVFHFCSKRNAFVLCDISVCDVILLDLWGQKWE